MGVKVGVGVAEATAAAVAVSSANAFRLVGGAGKVAVASSGGNCWHAAASPAMSQINKSAIGRRYKGAMVREGWTIATRCRVAVSSFLGSANVDQFSGKRREAEKAIAGDNNIIFDAHPPFTR